MKVSVFEMCGRFTLIEFEGIVERFQLSDLHFNLKSRYNVAPSQEIPVVLKKGVNALALFKWGLIPSWAKDPAIGNKMINARAETLNEKPTFKALLPRQRCLIIADGFYEWKRGGRVKHPYRITLKNNSLFGFAGLWDIWRSPSGEVIHSCIIITTASNELMGTIHDRMPVILTQDAEQAWLDPTITDDSLLKRLLKPYPSDLMTAYEVSEVVNSPKNDFPECLVSVSDNTLFPDFEKREQI